MEMIMLNKYIQATGIWFLIIPLAIINGGLRENILIKLGDIALPLSGIILSICIFVVAYLLIPKIKNCKKTDYDKMCYNAKQAAKQFDFKVLTDKFEQVINYVVKKKEK